MVVQGAPSKKAVFSGNEGKGQLHSQTRKRSQSVQLFPAPKYGPCALAPRPAWEAAKESNRAAAVQEEIRRQKALHSDTHRPSPAERVERRLAVIRTDEGARTRLLEAAQATLAERERERLKVRARTPCSYVEENRAASARELQDFSSTVGPEGVDWENEPPNRVRRRARQLRAATAAEDRKERALKALMQRDMRAALDMAKKAAETSTARNTRRMRDAAVVDMIIEQSFFRNHGPARAWCSLLITARQISLVCHAVEAARNLRKWMNSKARVLTRFVRRCIIRRKVQRKADILVLWLGSIINDSPLRRFARRLRMSCRWLQMKWKSRAACIQANQTMLDKWWQKNYSFAGPTPKDMLARWSKKARLVWIVTVLAHERQHLWPQLEAQLLRSGLSPAELQSRLKEVRRRGSLSRTLSASGSFRLPGDARPPHPPMLSRIPTAEEGALMAEVAKAAYTQKPRLTIIQQKDLLKATAGAAGRRTTISRQVSAVDQDSNNTNTDMNTNRRVSVNRKSVINRQPSMGGSGALANTTNNRASFIGKPLSPRGSVVINNNSTSPRGSVVARASFVSGKQEDLLSSLSSPRARAPSTLTRMQSFRSQQSISEHPSATVNLPTSVGRLSIIRSNVSHAGMYEGSGASRATFISNGPLPRSRAPSVLVTNAEGGRADSDAGA